MLSAPHRFTVNSSGVTENLSSWILMTINTHHPTIGCRESISTTRMVTGIEAAGLVWRNFPLLLQGSRIYLDLLDKTSAICSGDGGSAMFTAILRPNAPYLRVPSSAFLGEWGREDDGGGRNPNSNDVGRGREWLETVGIRKKNLEIVLEPM